jgi:hypothetical protein
MKHYSIKTFILILSVTALLSACGLPLPGAGGGQTQSAATSDSSQTQEAPVATPTPEKYFQEDFNGDLTNWSQFVVDATKLAKSGNPNLADASFGKMTVGVTDGFLAFDLESVGQWAYITYDPQTYDDVKVEASAENRGNNDNSVSLVCRYDPAEGWYEFIIANTGRYAIDYVITKSDKTVIYSKLADGGFSKIKSGKDTNQYGATCQGRTLTLSINGVNVKTIDDNQYVLKKGKIGLSVSSALKTANLPAKVGVDWVKISQP